MPGEFSDTGSNAALDAVTGRATVTSVTTYLALCSTAPTDTALGTEIATAGYSRQAVTWSAPAPASGVPTSSNTSTVTFGPFTADPPNVTHCMLMDVSTAGDATNLRAWWALDAARDAADGDSIVFNAGALTIAVD